LHTDTSSIANYHVPSNGSIAYSAETLPLRLDPSDLSHLFLDAGIERVVVTQRLTDEDVHGPKRQGCENPEWS